MGYDYVIIGSGLTGSTLARKLAESGKRVLILEKRDCLGGNVYDEYDEAGVLVQRFGVHVFHTDNEEVFDFLSRFTEWLPFSITCLISIQGKETEVPFNFSCIDTFYKEEEGRQLKTDLLEEFPGRERVPVIDLLQSSKANIRGFGQFLFENDYKPYTCKQWGRKPEDIDVSILSRVQICLSYDNRYFADKYQCMPKNGFTEMMRNMLDHPNIELRLGCDAQSLLSFNNNEAALEGISTNYIIYTGALDRLFDYCFGSLPYRTLEWVYDTYQVDKYLNAPFVSYPLHPTLSRKIEFKSITQQEIRGVTTVLSEYPMEYVMGDEGHDPLYPIISEKNLEKSAVYQDHAKQFKNLICAGRLADYKYYDMDDAVDRALRVFDAIQRKKQ